MAVLVAMSWMSIALAQAESDGDGLDGDKLGQSCSSDSLPISGGESFGGACATRNHSISRAAALAAALQEHYNQERDACHQPVADPTICWVVIIRRHQLTGRWVRAPLAQVRELPAPVQAPLVQVLRSAQENQQAIRPRSGDQPTRRRAP